MAIETIAELLVAADALRSRMGWLLHGVMAPAGKDEVAAALLRVSFAHYYSIVLLIGRGQRASALALMRPCSDTAQRSLYSHLCWNPELQKKIEDRFPHAFGKQKDMVDAIHREVGFPVFQAVHDDHGMMSDWTHGGTDQIAFQIPADPDAPMREDVSDAECYSALTQVTWPLVYTTYHLHAAWTGNTKAALDMLQYYYYFETFPFPLDMLPILAGLNSAGR
jgi:hypothetical protein